MRKAAAFSFTSCTRNTFAPPCAQQRSKRDRRREPIDSFEFGADHLPRNDFARNADHERPIVNAQTAEVFQELEIVLKRFAESNSRIKRDGHGINAASLGRAHIVVEKNPPPHRRHRHSADATCIVRGVPCMCMMMNAAFFSAASGIIAGSPRPPVTSLMIDCSRLECRARNAGFRSVDGNQRRRRRSQFRDHGNYAPEFFFDRNRFCARPGRFSSYIDDLRALFGHADSVFDRLLVRKKFTAI